MNENGRAVDLQRVLGSLVVASGSSISARELRDVLRSVAESGEEEGRAFAGVTESQIRSAMEEISAKLDNLGMGFSVGEVAGGYKLQTDGCCGSWVSSLLKIERSGRLSRPALETLAIIAYRQPVTRAEIEAVRGVNADHVIGTLLEMQVIRIAGRSNLPGRPLLYGTTDLFLEHFGLKDIESLPNAAELRRFAGMSARETAGQADRPVVAAGSEAIGGADVAGADERGKHESDQEAGNTQETN